MVFTNIFTLPRQAFQEIKNKIDIPCLKRNTKRTLTSGISCQNEIDLAMKLSHWFMKLT